MNNKSIFSLLQKKILLGCTLILISISSHANELAGDWQGSLDVQGQLLPLVIHLKEENNEQLGSLDTPSQGGFGIEMSKLKFSDDKLMFEIAALSIHYEGKYNPKKGIIEGTFIQGAPFNLSLSRVGSDAENYSVSSKSELVLGSWQGVIQIPSNPLTFVLNIKQKDGKLIAFAESPDQHLDQIKVDKVTFNSGELLFTIKDLKISYKGNLLKDGSKIKGDFTQSDYQFYLEMSQEPVKKK